MELNKDLVSILNSIINGKQTVYYINNIFKNYKKSVEEVEKLKNKGFITLTREHGELVAKITEKGKNIVNILNSFQKYATKQLTFTGSITMSK